MTDKVIDASAIAAVVFDEVERQSVETRLADATLFAPFILDFEMASVCLKKIRARPSEQAALLNAFAGFMLLPVIRMQIDFSEAIALAERLRLSIYDASYLWLARYLNAELVTLDDKLLKASKRLP